MSAGEVIAWQAGVDWFRAGRSAADWTRKTDLERRRLLSTAAVEALDQVGALTFGHWFGVGLVDAARSGRA